jgi:hypothetical protein
MEAMRELMRGSLARSLRALRDEDRLASAWTVACGRAMAERGAVVGYEGGVVRVEVADALWMGQMISLRGELAREMARIAGLPVSGIHFELKKAAPTTTTAIADNVSAT